MQIYLPIAELSVNVFGILALGGVAGVLSGMFGVGGGFLMTPLLMFIGIPASVAVATSANQIVASSFSGFLAHARRQNVDFRMGTLLLTGGLIGSTLGVWLFEWLQSLGQIDLVISLTYVIFLGSIGGLMMMESLRTLSGTPAPPLSRTHAFLREGMARLPLQTFFPRSQLTVSALLPLAIGFCVGVLVSIMGIGGGFFIIPAMIYILGMPTSVVIGTSLFQIIFITANVTILQAVSTYTVDIVLAVLLLAGSVFGAQLGTRMGARIAPEKLRGMLALLVVLVALRLAYGMFAAPEHQYSITAAAMR